MSDLELWIGRPDVIRHWPQAENVPPEALAELIAVAVVQCKAYAPPLPLADLAPVNYRLAAIYQVRELWAAAKRDGDVITADAYAIRARPLTATVKSLLRPATGKPVLG